MFNDPHTFLYLTDYPDHRGNIFEMLRFKDQGVPGDGQIYCFSILPDIRRGDHYHADKREWASCVYGTVDVFVEDKNGIKQKFALDWKKPSVIYFHPYTAHTFINNSNDVAVVVAYSSKQLDKLNPDTISKIVNL